MEGFWKFLMGPVLVGCLVFMAAGLARIVFLQVYELQLVFQTQPARGSGFGGRLLRLLLMAWRASPRLELPAPATILSITFYTLVIFLAGFLADHIVFWGGGIASGRAGFEKEIADWPALAALAIGSALILMRMVHGPTRRASATSDYVLLALLMAALISGFLAAHPQPLPIGYFTLMIAHAACAEAAMALFPFSRLAEKVLHPVRVENMTRWSETDDAVSSRDDRRLIGPKGVCDENA